tara:strand:- start:229 stop:765 length:537 start_codon:yes stop_codon:yes gene_type:complete
MADIHITIDPTEAVEDLVFKLNARRTLNGDIIIRDHPDVDIVVMVKLKKIVAFPKDSMSEGVYQTQDKLFNHLSKKGVVSPDSVQGGSLHGSMEAKILDNKELNVISVSLVSIANFVEEEKPYFEYMDAFEKEQDKRLTAPDEEESTEYDPGRHSDTKGTLRPIYIRSPYGISFTYRE